MTTEIPSAQLPAGVTSRIEFVDGGVPLAEMINVHIGDSQNVEMQCIRAFQEIVDYFQTRREPINPKALRRVIQWLAAKYGEEQPR